MTRPPVLRALLALLVLGLSSFFAFTQEPRLGLDLRGGTSVTLETRDSPTTVADAEATDRALEVLRRRVDALGVSEPTLARSGSNRIIVELPDVQDRAAAVEALGQTAQLTFHAVLGPGNPAEVVGADPAATPDPSATPSATPAPDASAAPGDPASDEFDPTVEQTILDEREGAILIGPVALTGDGVSDATSVIDPQTGTRSVSITFQGEGGRTWEQLTAAAACQPPLDDRRRVAIVLDGQAISSPQVNESVRCNVGIQGGSTQITGDFSVEEATELSVLIAGGALPVPVEVISSSTVGPSLGQAAIDQSIRAGIIGISLTAIFLVIVYRFVGVLAAAALTSYGVISYGALTALGATLTLPGLGGLLLSAGLAIDANVLVFERAREEFAASRSKKLVPALNNGFAKAFSAIADSNVTTLLAAGLLFLLASGPVRGFGITLVIGVLASIASALLVTRVLTEFGLARGLVAKRPGISGLGSLGRLRIFLERRKPDLMQYSKRFLAVALIALLLSSAGMVVRGFNFGVEFTGGRVLEFGSAQGVSVGDARKVVEDAGFPTAVVQQSNGENITVRTAAIDDDEIESIRAALETTAGGGQTTVLNDEFIGPTLGDELRTKALIAFAIALLAQLAYLAVRFRWTFAAGTVLAMLHDVLIVIGVFAWLGKPIDGVFLAAALTIIGVSVNDSVVTMDRIRETWSNNRNKPLSQIANSAIISTAPRTINTGIGALFILGALAVLGGRSLTDFAVALLIGLIVGTYSSAFVATPLVLLLERRNSAPPPMPKRTGSSATPRAKSAAGRRSQPVRARVRPEGGTV